MSCLQHTTWQHVLIHIKSPNDLDTCHVKWVPETTFWHKKLNQTLGPFGDSSWHAQPILPKFGGVFCLCTIGPQKGPKVSFDSLCQKVVLGVQTTFQVSKLFGLLICINTSCQVVCDGFLYPNLGYRALVIFLWPNSSVSLTNV